ncbi:cytochrome b subunit of formate dehydrogenase [Paraburkholderia sp. GAS333]
MAVILQEACHWAVVRCFLLLISGLARYWLRDAFVAK